MDDKVQKALGHVAGIVPFDDETVLFPLNEDEARWLVSMVMNVIRKLDKSGDFPEKDAYINLYKNLNIAHSMFLMSKPSRKGV